MTGPGSTGNLIPAAAGFIPGSGRSIQGRCSLRLFNLCRASFRGGSGLDCSLPVHHRCGPIQGPDRHRARTRDARHGPGMRSALP